MGYSLLIGGVARVDLLVLPARTIYVTVWASDMLPLHVGRTDTAAERLERFSGKELVPPVDANEARQMGPLREKQVRTRAYIPWIQHHTSAAPTLSRYRLVAGRERVFEAACAAHAQSSIRLVSPQVSILGDNWDESSADVCVAGLGWIAFGFQGRADLAVWAPEGVAVTSRDALLPDYAAVFERPGWSENSKAVLSNAARK